jgi:dTDP-4-dehydrorhamnose reductase
MKVLVIGRNGQLAKELLATASEDFDVLAVGRDDVELNELATIEKVVCKFMPKVIINTAAYTAVDRAEIDVDAAFALNKVAVKNLAKVAVQNNIRFLHVSTDFVFDGKLNKPYSTAECPNPISIYGMSKYAGELVVQEFAQKNFSIIRTSWLYSEYGSNFVKTMLKLMAEKDSLSIVSDQIGCPTYGRDFASFLWSLCTEECLESTYHWCDAGIASWYDFAVAIQELALQEKILDKPIPIEPISSDFYPTSAARPRFSVLDTSTSSKIRKPHYWREALGRCITRLK